MPKPRDRVARRIKEEAGYFLLPAQLLEHEVVSLKRMAAVRWPTTLSWWNRSLLAASNRAQNERILELHLWFEAHDPSARATDNPHVIELGAKIDLSGHPLITYFMAIGIRDTANTRQGLRKIHFDVEPIFDPNEPKPTLHMQFPGGMPAALCEVGYRNDAFDILKPDLNKPRVPSLPTSFLLLTHWAMLEYHTTEDQIETIMNSPEWINIVKAEETQILVPFFGHSHSWLGKTANEKRSLLSYYYGLPRLQ